GEAGASSLGVHGRESPASRDFLSRGSGGGWQRQWCAWSAPALPRELLCSFCHWSGRAQHRSGLPPTRGLTLPSSGLARLGRATLVLHFRSARPPLGRISCQTSSVRYSAVCTPTLTASLGPVPA